MASECRGGKARVSFFLSFLVLAMSALPAFAAHTPRAGLEPEWSPANTQVGYQVTLHNLAGDTVDEFRIYRNLSYTNFSCSPLPGWDMLFSNPKQACEYTADPFSPDYHPIAAGESVSVNFSAKTPNAGQCQRQWQFETRDVNNVWLFSYNQTSVDDNAPIITKVVGTPQVKVDDSTYYITQNTEITLSAVDPAEPNGCAASGIKYCRYRYTVSETGVQSGWTDWTANAANGYTFTFPEDSTHLVEVECADNAGNVANLTETDYVDTAHPNTTKSYGRPFVTDGTYDWITSATPITLNASDPVPHPAGVKEIRWRNTLLPRVPDSECIAKCDFDGDQYEGQWNIVQGDHATIYKPEQSCHLIEFFAVDNLGNAEPRNKQCVFVDNTPPEGSKVIGEPKVIKTTGGCVSSNVTPGDNVSGSVGSHVATVNFSQPCASGTGVGVAFDGQNLWYSCYNSQPDLYRADPITGTVTASYTVAGSLGALAYDASRNAIWAGWGSGDAKVRLLQLNGSKNLVNSTVVFTAPQAIVVGLDDGLAYDAKDDTLYLSDDVSTVIHHYTTSGAYLGNFAWAGSGCYNSGLALGGDLMYEGSNGCSKVWVVNKTAPGVVVFNFSTIQPGDPNFRDEDLECDTNTFAAQGKHVMWSVEAYNPRRALAFEIPFGSCGIGGKPPVCENTTDIYVTKNTNITLSCRDPIPHPVKQETVFWQFSNHDGQNWSYSDWFSSTQLPVKVHFNEDSYHDLTYYCKDGLNNTGAKDKEYFYVETVPPVINKTVVGPQYAEVGTCPPKSVNDKCFILANATTIHVEAYDPKPHPVDDVRCDWSYTLNGELMGGRQGLVPPFDITFPEDSTHELTITCEDALHNKVVDVETFRVDAKPPVTTKAYGEPFYYDDATGREYMTSETNVTLNAEDAKSGVDKIYYLNTLVTGENQRMCEYPQSYCQPIHGYDDDWIEYTKPFTKTPESCHVIEYWSVDKLGNKEPIRAQCVYVDNSYPILNKTVGTPKFPCEAPGGTNTSCWWVRDHFTPVTLDCTDQIPHPVGGEQACYKVGYDLAPFNMTDQYCKNNGGQMEDGWCCADVSNNPYTFDFTEDSWHNLTFFCRDRLGNTNPVKDFEYFRVDSTPPTTTKTYGGPRYVNETTGAEYLDSASYIELSAVDGGQHCAIGEVKTYWQNILQDDSYCQSPQKCAEWSPDNLNSEEWNLYTGHIYQREESCHVFAYYSEDKLGNAEDVKWQCFFVDKKPPVTEKSYSGPYFQNATAEWINSSTVITLSAYDPQPHPSGVNYTKSRYALVDDVYCRDKQLCNAYNSTIDKEYDKSSPILYQFGIPEESCHLIEYSSVDNVEKPEPVNRQCVFVDNTPPKPVKTVGEPKSTWSGNDSKFYPWIKDLCWNGQDNQIECWKVTTLTSVKLGCEDQGPHPVDHSTIAFNINLDNMTDITSEYCRKEGIRGKMVDGFCEVGREAPITLRFGEESEHNLKYYCTDALGNRGPIDEEKFKVEGTAFELNLYKKWNLISVPFVLLNDDPADVFKDVKDNISAVWSYDNGNWSVWTPNDGPGTLQHIKPGWGYWVLSNADKKIWIGGALFSPITPPPEKELGKGWNLIGYYGTDWQSYGDDPSCSYNVGSVYWDYAYCSMNSLTDVAGREKWSDLTTFVNCGGGSWKSLNACTNDATKNKMVAGYGYWVYMKDQAGYAPASVCHPQTSCVYFTPS